MNQEFKHGKDERAWQDKMIEFLMMNCARCCFLRKKLAKVNMPSTFLGLGKERRVKKILLEMDNYYDAQKLDKISMVVTFLKDHALEWWTSKKRKNTRWWQIWSRLVSRSYLLIGSLGNINELGANDNIGSLKGYVHVFNAQMNVTPKMDKFAKKRIFLGGLQSWVVDVLLKVPKLAKL
jgi:hypothetical protein